MNMYVISYRTLLIIELARAYITDPDSDFGEVCPGRDLFACRHVRIAVALERRLEVLQLLTGEMRALTALATAAAGTSGAAGSRQ